MLWMVVFFLCYSNNNVDFFYLSFCIVCLRDIHPVLLFMQNSEKYVPILAKEATVRHEQKCFIYRKTNERKDSHARVELDSVYTVYFFLSSEILISLLFMILQSILSV